MTVSLRAVSEADYPAFVQTMDQDYYESRAKADGISLKEARTFAQQQIANLRSQGRETPGHSFLHLHQDEQRIGRSWLFIEGDRAFLYDIQIDVAYRGKGLGKLAMTALEDYARQQGARALSLNVFSFNTRAQELYQSQGYGVSSLHMRKDLV